jgi:hypothetical protein
LTFDQPDVDWKNGSTASSLILARITRQIKDAVAYEILQASVTLPASIRFSSDTPLRIDPLIEPAADISQSYALNKLQKRFI